MKLEIPRGLWGGGGGRPLAPQTRERERESPRTLIYASREHLTAHRAAQRCMGSLALSDIHIYRTIYFLYNALSVYESTYIYGIAVPSRNSQMLLYTTIYIVAIIRTIEMDSIAIRFNFCFLFKISFVFLIPIYLLPSTRGA